VLKTKLNNCTLNPHLSWDCSKSGTLDSLRAQVSELGTWNPIDNQCSFTPAILASFLLAQGSLNNDV
jgi:hypothetical protein